MVKLSIVVGGIFTRWHKHRGIGHLALELSLSSEREPYNAFRSWLGGQVVLFCNSCDINTFLVTVVFDDLVNSAIA